MEAADMLDVLHYFFEEDYRYSTFEESEYKDIFRSKIYKDMYSVDYAYYSEKEKEDIKDFDEILPEEVEEVEDPIQPFSPRVKQTKAYVPPTELTNNVERPFGDILDQPLG
jgi:hypothetical protein